jgi:hypothetical protein
MAKAKYHKFGTWVHVEAVVPKWVKGCEEPIKIAYDCGMGREFAQEELEEESAALQANGANGLGPWRILRTQSLEKRRPMQASPFPDTHPMVVTTDRDWGSWRVPGAEYDLNPYRIER